MVEKTKVACFSGHRKLPHDCAELRANLERAIISLIEQGVVFFGSGAALGFGQIASETVLKLKENYPHIRLIMVLPCPPQEQSLNLFFQPPDSCFLKKQGSRQTAGASIYIQQVSPNHLGGCGFSRMFPLPSALTYGIPCSLAVYAASL